MSFDKLFEKQKTNAKTSKHSNIQESKPESEPNLDSETSKHSDAETSNNPSSDSSDREEQATTQPNLQTSEHSNVKTSKAKSKNDEYIRTTLYLPRKAHQRLKMASISQQEDMSEIVTRLIEDWLEHSDI